jgi:hypothetical protein
MRETGAAAGFDLRAFPVDPRFPQLEVAGDPGRMLEVFRTHLKSVPGKACTILECTPYRFRCFQSLSRCVLQYSLRVVDSSSGRQWDQWATGLIYADPSEAQRLWQILQTAEPASEVPEPWRAFESVNFVPELDMVVEVFPYDRRLPQLARALNGASRDLEPLLLARLGSGWWQAEGRTIEPVRYRTEMGAVLRYTLPAREAETGRDETLRCYLKVYRNERGAETFERLQSWTQDARPDYSLVRPIAYLDDLRTLALEEAPGASLREVLLGARDPVAAVCTVARATAAFHRDNLDTVRTYTAAEHRDDLRLASTLVQWVCPMKRAMIAGVGAVVGGNLMDSRPETLHGDLTADHVFLSGDEVTFVDTDSVARGDPVRDPALLFASIVRTLSLHSVPREDALGIAGAFHQEYFKHVRPAWRGRFRLHCASAFIEAAADIFRTQESGWRDRVPEMALNARQALAGEFG